MATIKSTWLGALGDDPGKMIEAMPWTGWEGALNSVLSYSRPGQSFPCVPVLSFESGDPRDATGK